MIRLGIGFATGRKNFKRVLEVYLRNWNFVKDKIRDEEISLNLFVAYDTCYQNTQSTEFTNLSQNIVDSFDKVIFIGQKNVSLSFKLLIEKSGLDERDVKTLFSSGYAGKRNSVLFSAIANHMDYLLFLDDDEYPMAVTNNHDVALWSGQPVFYSHLKEISKADFTTGYHCGYVSPIPQIDFDKTLSETDFKLFIETISNDIINWDHIRDLMRTQGVTYADTDVLIQKKAKEVPLIHGCRFISGANLCINLTNAQKTLPFFNPPGARGEDTFLSTLLEDRRVLQVPVYAFHDGFGYYKEILSGALPIELAPIDMTNKVVEKRFLSACIGWIRYKPLYILLTDPEHSEERMDAVNDALTQVLPKMAAKFNNNQFSSIKDEFNIYRKRAPKHCRMFESSQKSWNDLMKIFID